MRWLGNRRHSTAEDLQEEMESHVLEKAEALELAGMSPQEALTAARRSFGNQALLQDRAQEIWDNRPLNPLTTSFRFAFAQLKRTPVFTSTAILILSLGIGANTAIFTVLYQAIFRTLPVTNPERLVFVSMIGPKYPVPGRRPSYLILSRLASQPTDLESVSGWVRDRVMAADEENHERSLNATLMTGNAFDVLGVRPEMGRLLTSEDNEQEHPAVWPIVLSYNFWSAKYHRDPSAIGEQITISGRQAKIVGITPSGFEGITPNMPTQMYLPMAFLSAQGDTGRRDPLHAEDLFGFTTVGRLREGVTLKEANAHLRESTTKWLRHELQPLVARDPTLEEMSLQMTSASRGQQALDDYGSTLTLLQILMGSALLFCCINVSGLQLARTLERAHEFAVRIALGANRSHLVRQCLMEALIVTSGGAMLALPITFASTHLLSNFLTKPGAGEIVMLHPDWRMFAIAGVFTGFCTVAVGIVPVLFAKKANPASVLKGKSSMKRQPAMASKVLLAAQIAMTFLLLTTASFYWRTLQQIYGEDLGYNPVHVTEIAAQFQRMQNPEDIMSTYRRMLHQLNAHKGITSATMTWITQLTTFDPQIHVALPKSDEVKQISFNQVGPGYFETLQTKLLLGREFTDEDTDDSRCILNELAVRKIFNRAPSEVLGRRVRLSFYSEINTVCEVIGIVQSAKYADIHTSKSAILFLPITPVSIRPGGFNNNMVFLIRGEQEKEVEAAYLDVLAHVAPGTGYSRFLPMQRQLNDALGKERLLSFMTMFFGSIALLLCGAATLSLLLMRVKLSIPEIAIRVALGATPLHAAATVLREMVALIVIGTAVGGVSLRGVEYLSTYYLHYGRSVAMGDLLIASGLLVTILLCAGGIPAIRAATLHPMNALCRDS